MNNKKEDPSGMESLVDTWMKSMGEFWTGMASTWAGAPTGNPESHAKDSGIGNKAQETMASALKNWQIISAAMAEPESMASLFKGAGVMPEILSQMAQSSMGSLMEMQKKMVERVGRMGDTVEAYRFEGIEENLFGVWSDIYDKEFRQFFQIPQLGLLRTYQEKTNQVVDKYNQFQYQLSEFLSLLGLPFNRSIKVMQDKLAEMAEEGELPNDANVYYQMWIKILEGHFMTLFQTPEYVQALAKTVNALSDLSGAKDSFFEDLLNSLPVAKKSDMDDMAREIYELKKRIRLLEKNQKRS